MNYPDKIICLTEESVETLYLLGREDLIVGISQYVERPVEAKSLPVVTQFIRSDIEKIVAMKADLILGFSDLQKDIAAELIGRGQNVFITNQRSLKDILNYVLMIGRIVGEEGKALQLIKTFEQKLDSIKIATRNFKRRPKVYFEEWDHPRISCIEWVSELIFASGGESIFVHELGSMGKDRIVQDKEIIERAPDIIFGCWCGKAVKVDSFAKRPGYESIPAIQNNCIWELPPAIYLQPGPALFVDGLDQMFEKIQKVAALDV